MNWPNDADGDVFRRLQSRGFDFHREYLVDFDVEFESWPPAAGAIDLLRKEYPSTVVYDETDERSGYVQFQVHGRVTYEMVTRVQAMISALMAPFGGKCESWGVLH